MKVVEKIEALRKLMKEHNLNWYYIPSNDYHMSEYVGSYFKERAFMSGFNGSAGFLLIGLNEAYLWTDGRYFLQATKDLEKTPIRLMKMFTPGYPTLIEFIKEFDDVRLGMDGRCVPSKLGNELLNLDNVTLNYDLDLVDEIWSDRPSISHEPIKVIDTKYVGKSLKTKIKEFKDELKENNMDYAIISSLDDIMWLLNIRGNDVLCSPVALSHLIISKRKVNLFIQSEALNEESRNYLLKNHIVINEYNEFYDFVKLIKKKNVVVDLNRINFKTYMNIDESNHVENKPNYSQLKKAIKNKKEIKNMRLAHIKDGVAVTRFMGYTKRNIGKVKMDELSSVKKLEEYRQMGENYLGPSFETIAGFGPHGAIIHYGPNEKTNIPLKLNNLFLVDSGGHYLEGTTDITRTFALGKVSDKMKHDYTIVLKSYLALSTAIFLEGTTGVTLDYAAREPMWKLGLDYRHGTGHGVGYLLNVHEGPNGISSRNDFPFYEGMITSDEPGLYIENEYGIRHESLVLSKLYTQNEYGKFLTFEPITMAPFDRDAIDPKLLTKEELKKLNKYHKTVYKKLAKYMSGDDLEYLVYATKRITRK